jgi:hypothetical protein
MAFGSYVPLALFICFERLLQVVDEALVSATEAQQKTSKDADEKFKNAIDALIAYEKMHHSSETVAERMKKAEEVDKSSMTLLNRLKNNFHVRKELTLLLCRNTNADSQPLEEGPITTVEFHLHKSLPDKSPTIVKRER